MKTHFLFIIFLFLSFSCKDKSILPEDKSKAEYHLFTPDEFAMGVDLSYLNQIEDHGGIYKDS